MRQLYDYDLGMYGHQRPTRRPFINRGSDGIDSAVWDVIFRTGITKDAQRLARP